MTIPDRIRSSILAHQVDLLRYEAGLRRDIRDMLIELGRDLNRALIGSGVDTPRTDWQRARMRSLSKEAEKVIQETFGTISEAHLGEMGGLVRVSSAGVVSAINEALGASIMVPPKWTAEQLAAIVGNTMIEGAPSATWWERQAHGLSEKFADTIRQGLLRGENIAQLRDRIMPLDIPGVDAVGKVDLRRIPAQGRGVIWDARRNAEALVRTSVISLAGEAHLSAYEANADIMAGYQWCSTLDSRTTPICRALDGLRWDMNFDPIGHGFPYPGPTAHWGCRSFTLPVTKTWEELAREAHGNSKLAKDLDKVEPGQRASMGGPVSGDLTYEGWFDTLKKAQQEDILGPKRYALWKQGKLAFQDMVDQTGN
ncbi:MAG TPA: phage minor head protein, partial [Geothrix sp.]|nr:phage minor head protein [Geothrix sp.]